MPANLTIYVGTVNSTGVRVPLVCRLSAANRTDNERATYCRGGRQTSDQAIVIAGGCDKYRVSFEISERTYTDNRRPEASTAGAFIGRNQWQLISPDGRHKRQREHGDLYGQVICLMVLPSPVNVPTM